ncbi:MAG: uroporphyrinogen-III synthase [Pseudomonadota bacterium]
MTQDQPASPTDTRPICLITRPEDAAQELARIARDLGYETIISPVLRITFEPPVLAATDSDRTGVIVTSQHAVAWLDKADPGRKVSVYAVGPRTAADARALGYDAWEGPGDADGLVRALIEERPTKALVHLRGAHTRGDVAQRLSAAGIPTEETIVYHQHAQKLSTPAQDALNGARPVVIPLLSPRSAAIVTSGPPPLAPCIIVALSAAVAGNQAWGPDVPMRVCSAPDLRSLQVRLSEVLDTEAWVEGARAGR